MTELTTIKLKVLIFETLQAQRDFVSFLRKVGQRYGRLLDEAEVCEAATLMERASETIDRLTQIMENATITISEDKRPPDKLPVYPLGGGPS